MTIVEILSNVLFQEAQTPEIRAAPMAVDIAETLTAMAEQAHADATALLGVIPGEQIEAVARLICEDRGGDPEEPAAVGNPPGRGEVRVEKAWHAYTVIAAKVLAL